MAAARNAPQHSPPRDLVFTPAAFIHPEDNTLVTRVTTTRACPEPTAPEGALSGLNSGSRHKPAPLGAAPPPGGAPSPADDGEGSSSAASEAAIATAQRKAVDEHGDFASQVVEQPRQIFGRVPIGLGPESASPAAESMLASFFADDDRGDARGEGGFVRVSEYCKFLPREQEGLLRLRQRLLSAAAALEAVCTRLADDSASGLPSLKEQHRCRLAGKSFALEDARRELAEPHLVARMRDYVAFIDKALAGELDAPPGPGVPLPAPSAAPGEEAWRENVVLQAPRMSTARMKPFSPV